mmetsp:Transcript_3321/g.10374  ORF Transcript_3321/g.10374 Transcript_3321/m.10374 type:complete len:272 (+) Transcript_3321:2620-3435(+)
MRPRLQHVWRHAALFLQRHLQRARPCRGALGGSSSGRCRCRCCCCCCCCSCRRCCCACCRSGLTLKSLSVVGVAAPAPVPRTPCGAGGVGVSPPSRSKLPARMKPRSSESGCGAVASGVLEKAPSSDIWKEPRPRAPVSRDWEPLRGLSDEAMVIALSQPTSCWLIRKARIASPGPSIEGSSTEHSSGLLKRQRSTRSRSAIFCVPVLPSTSTAQRAPASGCGSGALPSPRRSSRTVTRIMPPFTGMCELLSVTRGGIIAATFALSCAPNG